MAKGSGYTVGELIEHLRAYPPSAPLGITDDACTEMQVLSIYQTTPGTPGDRVNGLDTVWIDLQVRPTR